MQVNTECSRNGNSDRTTRATLYQLMRLIAPLEFGAESVAFVMSEGAITGLCFELLSTVYRFEI